MFSDEVRGHSWHASKILSLCKLKGGWLYIKGVKSGLHVCRLEPRPPSNPFPLWRWVWVRDMVCVSLHFRKLLWATDYSGREAMLVEPTPGGKFPTKHLRLMYKCQFSYILKPTYIRVTCGSKQRRLSCTLVSQWQHIHVVPYSHTVKHISTYSLSSTGLCVVTA